MAACLLFIQHSAAQAGSDADDAVELMTADELAPLRGDVHLVLCRNDVGRGAMSAILVKEQPNDFMPTGKDCLAEAQRAS